MTIVLLKNTTDWSKPGRVGNLLMRICGHQEWVYVEAGSLPEIVERLQAESEQHCTTCQQASSAAIEEFPNPYEDEFNIHNHS